MDPLSHAALGRTLGTLLPEDRGRPAGVAAATLGALSPDLDAVFMPFGWDRYLVVHEIGTHTIVGTFACAVMVGVAVWSFWRKAPALSVLPGRHGSGRSQEAVAGESVVAAGRHRAPDVSWLGIAAAAWTGAASHVLLDLLSSARIRVFWPFADRQVSLPAVAMADPWLAAILIAGAVAIWIRHSHRRRLAVVALACALAFLLAKGMLASRAVAAYSAAQQNEQHGTAIVQAVWASLREWYVFDRTGSGLAAWRASAAPARAELVLEWPSSPDTPAITRSRRLPVVTNFLRAHHLAFAVSIPQEGGELVLWSDIRFCWDPSLPGAAQLQPVVTRGDRRLACALWFGAEYDAAGAPRRQVVRIGSFTQSRSPYD